MIIMYVSKSCTGGGYKECYCIKPTSAHVHNFIQ